MKIGQKGMSTSAIVAIVVTVVVVVIVVSVAAVLLIGGGGVGVGSLPLYAGATKSTGSNLGGTSGFLNAGIGRDKTMPDKPQGLDDELYVAPATTTSVSEVMNWYKTQMASQGWTLVYEESYSYEYMGFSMSWGLLYFDKGDRSAAVVVGEYGGETYFALVEGSDSLFDPWMDDGYDWTEPADGGGGGGDIGSATSLQFTVDVTAMGTTSTMTFKAKDIESAGMKIRVEGSAAGYDFVYIINGAQQTAWMYMMGTWTDLSDYFSTYWDDYSSSFEGYQTSLSGWTGGTYTSPDGSVTIRDIIVNPVLDDSLFVH